MVSFSQAQLANFHAKESAAVLNSFILTAPAGLLNIVMSGGEWQPTPLTSLKRNCASSPVM